MQWVLCVCVCVCVHACMCVYDYIHLYVCVCATHYNYTLPELKHVHWQISTFHRCYHWSIMTPVGSCHYEHNKYNGFPTTINQVTGNLPDGCLTEYSTQVHAQLANQKNYCISQYSCIYSWYATMQSITLHHGYNQKHWYCWNTMQNIYKGLNNVYTQVIIVAGISTNKTFHKHAHSLSLPRLPKFLNI